MSRTDTTELNPQRGDLLKTAPLRAPSRVMRPQEIGSKWPMKIMHWFTPPTERP